MTDCDQYLEDPEAHAAHLAECEHCSRLFATLEAPVHHDPVRLDALPLAPWEGAAHRPWSLVIAGALTVAILSVLLYFVAGDSPLAHLELFMTTSVPMLRLAAGAIRNEFGPVLLGLGFITVNALLFVLLRRAPKGIDA
jgi:hypothetical protein